MSWFRNSKAATTPDYTGLQLQTSVNTLPIPIVWGQTKAAANVVWYQNFQTHGGGSTGKGGFFGGGGASATLIPPTSSWRSARGRFRASASSGGTNRPTRSPSSA